MQLATAMAIAGIAVLSSAGAESRPPSATDLSFVSAHLDPPETTLLPNAPDSDPATDSFPRKGTTELAVLVGASLPASIYANQTRHDLALNKLALGRVVSGVLGRDYWFRGQLEVVGELIGGGQFNPRSAYLLGVTPMLRYELTTGTRFVPYLDMGLGATITDIGEPDLGGVFQFNDQAGVGLHWFCRHDLALTVQYRVVHFSNGGMFTPNHGINTTLLQVGVSWFF